MDLATTNASETYIKKRTRLEAPGTSCPEE